MDCCCWMYLIDICIVTGRDNFHTGVKSRDILHRPTMTQAAVRHDLWDVIQKAVKAGTVRQRERFLAKSQQTVAVQEYWKEVARSRPCFTVHNQHNLSLEPTSLTLGLHSRGSRPILVLELFTLVPRLFGRTCCCLCVQPVQLLPSRNIWRHLSLIWPFPHRYRHSPWPVDVTELFPRFCCWTLIWLSRHWAWLRRGYWRYRSWLIDWLILVCWQLQTVCGLFDFWFLDWQVPLNSVVLRILAM